MIGVDVGVHAVGVGCEDSCVRWERAEFMELLEEFLAVLDVSFDEGFELLEVVVKPSAQVVHKCTHTGYYGAHLPRGFVGF